MNTLEIIDNSGADATTTLAIRNGRIVGEHTPVPRWVSALARRLPIHRPAPDRAAPADDRRELREPDPRGR